MGNGKVYQCLTCSTAFEKAQPACNFCGQPTCFECRVKDAHFHSAQEKVQYAFGWCLVCMAEKPLKLETSLPNANDAVLDTPEARQIQTQLKAMKDGKPFLGTSVYRCVDCDYEWAPRALRSLSHPSQYICPFCGALQASVIFPFNCGRCAMELR